MAVSEECYAAAATVGCAVRVLCCADRVLAGQTSGAVCRAVGRRGAALLGYSSAAMPDGDERHSHSLSQAAALAPSAVFAQQRQWALRRRRLAREELAATAARLTNDSLSPLVYAAVKCDSDCDCDCTAGGGC